MELATRVRDAMGFIFDARDGRGDGHAALGAAEAHVLLALAETHEGDAACAALLATSSQLLTAARFVGVWAPPKQSVTPFRVSVGTPTPHAVDRSSVRPIARALPLPKPRAPVSLTGPGAERTARLLAAAAARRRPPPSPAAVDGEPPELDSNEAGPNEASRGEARADEPRAGSPVEAPPAATEITFSQSWTKTLFEELAALGMQRLPLADDDWRARAFIEDRLLSALDAFVGLGEEAIGSVPALVADAPAPDPWRMFAAGLVAGCVGGRDAAGFFEEALRGLDLLDADVGVALESAVRLAPSPDVITMLRGLRDDSSPTLRALAFRALVAADAASPEELLDATTDAATAAIALPWLATRRSPRAAPLALAALEVHAPEVRRAALRALYLAGYAELAPLLVRALAGPDRETAALYLGLLGDPGDVLLQSLAQPSVGRVLGVGWAGASASLTKLVACLSSPEDGVPEAAARALARILGRAPVVDRDVAPEDLAEADLFAPRAAPDASDASAGSPDTIRAYSTDPDHWRELVEAAKLPAGRVRHGQPLTPERILEELLLEDAEVPPTPDERALLIDQLVATTDWAVTYDSQQWVATQVTQLARLRAALR